MAARPSEHFTGRKNVCSKSGSKIFFRWNPDLSGVVLESAGIVPAAGTGGSAFESTVLLRIVGSASSCFGSFCATSLAGNSCPRSISERVFVHFNPFAGGMFECVFVFLNGFSHQVLSPELSIRCWIWPMRGPMENSNGRYNDFERGGDIFFDMKTDTYCTKDLLRVERCLIHRTLCRFLDKKYIAYRVKNLIVNEVSVSKALPR